jgi:hypothetical protein
MKRRSELLSIYKSFARMIHTQFTTIKKIRSDSGGEYLFDTFREFLTSEATLPQLSCPSAHVQNGVVERKHRHVIETARTLLISSFVPSHFWCETVSTVVYLINRQPLSKLSGITPGEVLFGTPTRYDHLRVFGCTCYVLLAPREWTKLSAQSVECVFLRYIPKHKGYQCYDPLARRIRISHDVSFNENRPFFYNSLTHSSFSTESTSFMWLPPIHAPSSGSSSSTTPSNPTSPPNVLIPITNPSTSAPTSNFASKPPITKTYIRHPRTSPTADPDEPIVDVCTNNDDSPVVSDYLQINDGSQPADSLPNHRGYHLRDHTTVEIIWLRWLLANLGVSCDTPTPLMCDNTSAIQIANDPVKHELTKHIGVDVFFTRSHCQQKIVILQHVPSEMQVANFFTKAQTREQNRLNLIKLNASDPPLPP